MKRFVFIFLLCAITKLAVCQQFITIEGITYKTISQEEVEIAFIEDKNKISQDIIIPQSITIDGKKYNVTAIDGFFSAPIRTITISEGVKTIKKGAFTQCKQLSTVNLPQSLRTIEKQAFQYCSSLTAIIIPKNVTVIEERAFFSCDKLTTINIPQGVNTIGKFAFYKCGNLSSVTIEEGVENIGEGAFWECKHLESVVIPNSVKHIGQKAFWQCQRLKTITVPDDAKIDTNDGYTLFMLCDSLGSIRGHHTYYPKWLVEHLKEVDKTYVPNSVQDWLSEAETTLETKGFNNKKVIFTSPHDGITYEPISDTEAKVFLTLNKEDVPESIIIPENIIIKGKEYRVTAIGDAAFLGCKKLKSIIVPKNIVSIGGAVFQDCRSLTSITFSQNLTSIKPGTFFGCTNLKSIKIPEGVTTIGSSAFVNCSALTSVFLPTSLDSIGPAAFSNCISLQDISLPKGMTTIEEGLFFNCKALKSIVIPNTVKHIKEFAFFRCLNLESIILPDEAVMEYAKHYELDETLNNLKIVDKSIDINEINNKLSSPYNLHAFALCENLTSIRGYNTPYPKWAVEYFKKETFLPVNKWATMAAAESDGAEGIKKENVKIQNTIINQVTENSIDQHVPVSSIRNDKTFAVIIGNENYKEVEPVPHALNDARIFAIYCEKTLGIPSKNIKVYEDATFGTILSAIDYIQQVSEAFQGDINIIFYYAGHGVPSESTNEAYLLPVDANGRNIAACYQIEKLYSELKNLNANQVTVFLDACFSGAQRGTGMLASSRGIAFNTKQAAPQGNMVVFSAASADETAYPFAEKGHGLFTYYLLKKLNETKGNVTLGELGRYICEKVAQESIVTNGKSQTPTVVPSADISTSWMEMKLIK